tara:strand:+ start:216 stop:569 length:354 start_codon:yes stop_codon:yes gene_type:complete
MLFLIIKAALSGVLIAIVSEVSRRYPGFGGLIASLPLISLLAIIWLWRDTGGDAAHVATHARSTFWYVLPSLPLFLIFPALLDRGMNFWMALSIGCLITVGLYVFARWTALHFGFSE